MRLVFFGNPPSFIFIKIPEIVRRIITSSNSEYFRGFFHLRGFIKAEPVYDIGITFTKVILIDKIKCNTFNGQLAQLVRALGSHPRGHWFESSTAHHYLVKFQFLRSMILPFISSRATESTHQLLQFLHNLVFWVVKYSTKE